jgi:hypothetical protein
MTDSASLPESGPGRDIFLASLRLYSEQCETPTLTPGCPFRVSMSNGEFECAEECMDLLAKYDKLGKAGRVTTLGSGWAYSRRVPIGRARRQKPDRRPFDAKEMLLQDKADNPMSAWRAASLFSLLTEGLEEVPPADTGQRHDRHERLKAAIDELDIRGFDTASIVKKIVIERLRAAVYLHCVYPLIVQSGEDDTITSVDQLPVADQANWEALIFNDGLTSEARRTATDSSETNFFLHEAFSRLESVSNYLVQCDVEELIDWQPPTAPVNLTSNWEPSDKAIWVTDRFTNAYLQEWAMPSLRLEWKWLHGEETAPCASREMQCRAIDSARLAEEIASRVTKDSDQGMPGVREAEHLIAPTLKMLQDGKRREAAAVFEALVRATPRNAVARNNRGFCLLIDDPRDALVELERANDFGFPSRSLNVANRMFALHRLGRVATALELAEEFYDDPSYSDDSVFLWSITSEEPEIENIKDVTIYICDLARMAAEGAGDTKAARLWTDRAIDKRRRFNKRQDEIEAP